MSQNFLHRQKVLLSHPVITFVGSHHERTAVVLHLDPVLHCGNVGSGGRPEPHLAPRVRSPRLSRYHMPKKFCPNSYSNLLYKLQVKTLWTNRQTEKQTNKHNEDIYV